MTTRKTSRKRLSAILGAALIFVLLASVALTLSMSASSKDVAFEVGPKNIDLGNELKIVYQVTDKSNVDDLDVKMYFWYSAPASYDVKTADYVASPISDEEKAAIKASAADYVFVSFGLPQTAMTQYVYAMVWAEADGVAYASEPVRYSVLDYVYQRRAEHESGKKLATADQLALYTATLRAGGAAQEFLGENTDRLADDKFAKVVLNGGLLADGFDNAYFSKGETFELIATDSDASGRPFVKWVDGKGNLLSRETSVSVTMGDVAAGVPTVNYTAIYGISDDASEPTIVNGTPIYINDSSTTVTDVAVNADKFGTENKVVSLIKSATGSASNIKAIATDKSADATANADVYVFEGSFYVEACKNGTSGNNTALHISLGDSYRLEISTATSTAMGTTTMMLWDNNYDGGRNFIGEVENTTDPTDAINWMNIRVEFYNGEQVAKVYLNGSLAAISHNSYYSTNENPDSITSYGEAVIALTENSEQATYVHGIVSEVCDGDFVDEECDKVLAPSYEATTYVDSWVVVENSLSEASVNALRGLYEFYDDPDVEGDEAWKWVASLYDAEIGAFYYAYSGKLTEGYLPDVEATSQALGYLASSGIFSTQKNDAKVALDTISAYINDTYGLDVDLRNDISAYAYSLLASDGLTRHPQWSQKLSEGSPRVGRDNGNGNALRDYGTNRTDVTILDSVSSTAAAVSYMMSGAQHLTIPLETSYNPNPVIATADELPKGTLPATLDVLEKYVADNYEALGTSSASLATSLKSVDAFIKYINNKSMCMSTAEPGTSGYVPSHGFGHGMSSSQSIIKAAGAQNLTIEGQLYLAEMKDVYIAYMNVWQLKTAEAAYEYGLEITGLWEPEFSDGLQEDGDSREYYTELSGLYKIGSFYNGEKRLFKNVKLSEIIEDPDELADYKAKFGIRDYGFERDENGNALEYGFVDAMLDRAIDGILGTANPTQFVHVYNPWQALSTVLGRMRAANEQAKRMVYDIDAVIEYIRGEDVIYDVDGQQMNRTEYMIYATIEKISPYRCVDGTFSYFKEYSDPATQNTPVGIGAKEGDTNANSLASNGMRDAIFKCLGLTRPAIFDGQADFDEFKELIAEEVLAAYEGTLSGKQHLEHHVEFEYDTINTYFVSSSATELVEEADGNKYLLLKDSDASDGKNVGFMLTKKLHSKGQAHLVDYNNIGYAMFQSDFYVDWSSAQTSTHGYQITLGTAKTYLYMLSIDRSGNNVVIGDAINTGNANSSQLMNDKGSKNITIADGQWFTVKVEYRVKSADSAVITVTVTEANGTVHTATSTNVYDGTVKTALSFNDTDRMLQVKSRDKCVTNIGIDNVSYGYASAPTVATSGGATVKGESGSVPNEEYDETVYSTLEYGETVTLRAPATDENGAKFSHFKRNTGMLSIYDANMIAQTAGATITDVTLPGYAAWFAEHGVIFREAKLVDGYYELEVTVPAGATTFTAVYDSTCTVNFVNVEDNNERAPLDGKYPAGEFTVSAPLKNNAGQLFDHWERNGVTVSYAATFTTNLPVGGEVELKAVYAEKTVNEQEFTGTDKTVSNGGTISFGEEDPTGEGRTNVMIHDMSPNLSSVNGGGNQPPTNSFATTAVSTKLLSFDMYMPKATVASVYTDYFNEANSFAGLYQISIAFGGETIGYIQLSAPNAGSIEGYYLGIAENSNPKRKVDFDNTTLYFDQWYTVTIEMVFSEDENGACTVPAFINLYLDGRFVGSSDIFYYLEEKNTVKDASVDYAAVADKELTIIRFYSPYRSKAVGYFDNLSYYESEE